jgi:hypothetical protein
MTNRPTPDLLVVSMGYGTAPIELPLGKRLSDQIAPPRLFKSSQNLADQEPTYLFCRLLLRRQFHGDGTMMSTKTTNLAFAAACLITVLAMPGARAQTAWTQTAATPEVVTNGPQTGPGDVSPYWSPQQNVLQSERYERLLQTSPSFRQVRMNKECGPISDPQLHADCVASFNRGAP